MIVCRCQGRQNFVQILQKFQQFWLTALDIGGEERGKVVLKGMGWVEL